MCSGGASSASSASIAGTKSSATVQQRHPFASSTICGAAQSSSPQLRRMSPSTPTSPNSLMTSARRRSCVASTRCRMSVVFPAPKKPVTMVAGILPLMLASRFCHAGQRRRREAETSAARGPANKENKTMIVSLPPRRRRLVGFRRQVSWLAGQRLAPPSRGFASAVAFGAASPLTVAGAAAGSESSSPRSLFTSREEPSALF